MIKPTLGRIVWYHPPSNQASAAFNPDPTGIHAAIIVKVHNDTLVNLTVFDSIGKSHPTTSVHLIQDGDAAPAEGNYCEWMPFQKGQAMKTDELEKKLTTGTMGAAKGNPDPSPFSDANKPVSIETK